MKTQVGNSYPLGSQVCEINGVVGVNFTLASRHANAITLCLFDNNGEETQVPLTEKTDDVWHIFIAGVQAGQRYGYRVAGEDNPARGLFFNPQKLLLDPYSKAVDGELIFRDEKELARFQIDDLQDNAIFAPKSIVTAPDDFDWGEDQNPRTPWDKTVIYELHVKGFSQENHEISTEKAGTFLGLAEPTTIEYLKNLGITAVELLPISYHADEPHLQKQGKINYWGYNVMAHFAPDPRFAYDRAQTLSEFKYLVKTLHAAGIEVILDVVFNHNAENGLAGPTFSQRGIDNRQYYFVDENGRYLDFTGCGNSFDLNNPIALRWTLDCLRYWVEECHVDGFRFDLASVLGRTPAFSRTAPFLAAVGQDPILSHCKMIAEPWDIGLGGYNIGNFPQKFSEWNGKFRDDLRTFWLKGGSSLGTLATRFAGSTDIFHHGYRKPRATINFITAHDGFTLCDLVSYNHKHNEANGEHNRDGENHNLSFNHGAEGETDDPTILAARGHSARALLASLILSQGVPMLLAGDEIGNSQGGNNNSYCQDNTIGWLNWTNLDQDLLTYVQKLIQVRQKLSIAGAYRHWWNAENACWFRPDGKKMTREDWHSPQTRALMLQLFDQFLILFNGNRGSQDFVLPKTKTWQFLLSSGFTLKNAIVNTEHLGVCVLTTDATNHHDSSEKTA